MGDFYLYKIENDGSKRYLAVMTVSVDKAYTEEQQSKRLFKFVADKSLAMPLGTRHQANGMIGIFWEELKECKVGNVNQ
jgi:hypothetical protein